MKVVISGASSGIGYELVKTLIEQGHEVFAFARNEEKLNQLKQECCFEEMKPLHVFPFDLSQFDNYKLLIDAIKQSLSNVDVLINNAGTLISKPFKDCSLDDFGSTFSTNVKAPFYLSQQLLPLYSKEAHIVNISSMGGFQGSVKFPGLALYSASKGALSILTEALSEELQDENIKVNCLALGAAQTEMLAKAFPEYKAPLSANQMAEFIANFAITGHRYFNGKILPISLSTP